MSFNSNMKLKDMLIKFYKNNDFILGKIVRLCKNREVAYVLQNGSYGPRPSILEYEDDLFEFIEKGMVSYHISLERWDNPLYLSEKKKKDIEEHRIGWDLIFDIDGKNLEISKIVAKNIIKFLRKKGIEKFYIKFSGSKGFHIAIPWEIFPKRVFINGEEKDTRKLYPILPKVLLYYIDKKIRDDTINEIKEKFGDIDNPYEIDYIAISNRHLIRGIYSLNEKTLTFSIPIKEKNIDKISPEDYKLSEDLIIYEYEVSEFLTEDLDENEDKNLRSLIYEAYANVMLEDLDKLFEQKYEINRDAEVESDIKKIKIKFKGKISEEYFPPCIKEILNNKDLSDGRKRAIFILINFFYNIGMSWDEIEKRIKDWNNNLTNPLRDRYVEYQLEWHKKVYSKEKGYLTPNCDNDVYYKDMGICKPDEICKLIKNPLSYPYKKLRTEKLN